MAALAVWAVAVADATYWKTGKILAMPIVLCTVGLFVGVWALSFRFRAGRTRGDGSDDADQRGPKNR